MASDEKDENCLEDLRLDLGEYRMTERERLLKQDEFRIVGVELQPDLAAMAERNGRENGLETRVSFRCGDLRDPSLLSSGAFDGVVANPPYESPGRGRESPVAARSIARQEACCSVDDVAASAARLLRGRGRFFAVFRTERMASFMEAALRANLVPKRPSKIGRASCRERV